MFILGALELAAGLFVSFGSFIVGHTAAPGSSNATLSTVLGIVGALAVAIGISSFVLGLLAVKRSQAVMWTIACFHSALAALGIVAFIGSAVSDGQNGNNIGAVATLVMSVLIVSFTLTKDARMHYRSGKSSSGN
ncbi:hypothetical protein [Nocardiopsis gilva]|uniref:hypothetical protein n=1 Tax=Nocardiopsis gilva TaxID=280236 RepID=UPI0005248FB0|nr:hypothetical protein [Nocardiopsis gilva]